MDTTLLNITGNTDLLEQGVRALDALRPLLIEQGGEYMLAEFDLRENAPITCVLSGEYTHDTFIWAPAGWVKLR
jgi:hypothetical protein